jgi:hypothetical protein
MSDEPKIVKWPGWDELDNRFEPYAVQLGWLAYSWNSLHDRLGNLFWALIDIKNGRIPLSIWNAVKNDRTQRDMLAALAKETLPADSKVLEEINWVLNRAESFEERRNNALHSPLTFIIDTSGPQLSSKWTSGNQRAVKLKDKDLLKEFEWYGRSANTLAVHVSRITLHIRAPNIQPELQRPEMPTLGQTG